MLMLALSSLRAQARRFLAPGLAVALGVAFVCTALGLSSALSAGIRSGLAGDLVQRTAVVTSTDPRTPLPAGTLAAARSVRGVDAAIGTRLSTARVAGSDGIVVVSSPPSAGSMARLESGRYPTRLGEVAYSLAAQSRSSVSVGTTVRIAPVDGGAPVALRVVGLVDAGRDSQYSAGVPVVFTTAAQVPALTGENGWARIDVDAAAGADSDSVVTALRRTLGTDATVRTGPEYAQDLVDEVGNGTSFLTYLLLGFAGIALFVCALVVSNTFTILMTRRSRESALLRCIGAARAQLVRATLLESALVGVLASAAGVLAGLALTVAVAAAARALDSPMLLSVTTPSVTTLLVPLVVGVLLTVLSSLRPVWRAGQVEPVAALQPDPPIRLDAQTGRTRLVGGVLLLLTGVGGLAAGVATGEEAGLLLGMAGGAASFCGLLLAAPLVVPGLVRALGAPTRRAGGVPAQLAVLNASRNPRRAASTTSALLVGVTLITMLTVGAATTQRSLMAFLDAHYAIDTAVTGPEEGLPQEVARRLAEVDGVRQTAQLRGATATIVSAAGRRSTIRAVGLDPAARAVVRSSSALARLRPGVAIVSPGTARAAGITDGGRVRLGSASLTASVSDRFGYDVVLTSSDLQAVGSPTVLRAVWVRYADDADPVDGLTAVQREVGATSGAQISGAAPVREQYVRVIDVMLLTATGLLGVAVLIALVGIGNTLSLSVLERGREIALMRALGLTRPQVRRMVGAEALLLSLVAAALGVVLGTAYGWVGARTLLGEVTAVRLDVPWVRLLIIAAVATGAGLLASVLPARRAAAVMPAAALAAD